MVINETTFTAELMSLLHRGLIQPVSETLELDLKALLKKHETTESPN